jgi:hypothetical protein
MGFDTKTYWLTDRQSKCDFEFDFEARSCKLGEVEKRSCRVTEESRELKSGDVDQNSGNRQSKELDRVKKT